MADKEKPRKRRRWLVPLLAIGAGAWYVRSRRGPDPDAWMPPLPAPAEEPKPAAPVESAEQVADVAAEEPAAPEEPAAKVAAPNALFTDSPEKGVAPLADGSAPGPEFVIKGNADSMLFHTQSSPYFGRTKAEVWFRTEEEATNAGFTKWSRRQKD
ncbi:MAG: hypothetical protein L0H84_09805 [Pseudonocardia sp.]|nr:hypothetical protein [Pseudonocardia sp.]